MVQRTPPPAVKPPSTLPHDHNRESSQPYAREVEDYGRGVSKPPKEQTAREVRPRSKGDRAKT
jgi:hypothetical protein